MLRVTVEIVPRGDESRKRRIAVMEIVNDGSGDAIIDDYYIQSCKDVYGEELAPQEPPLQVMQHQRELGAWALIRRAIGTLGLHV